MGAPRKRSAAPPDVAKPEGVAEQTWADWLKLRKTKKAPVTETVLRSAVAEAEKAGMPLENFLQVWCARGSQGLQADWLKPHERMTGNPAGKPRVYHDIRNMNYTRGVNDDLSF